MCFVCPFIHKIDLETSLIIKALDTGNYSEAVAQVGRLDDLLTEFKGVRDRDGLCSEATLSLAAYVFGGESCAVGRVIARLALKGRILYESAKSA